MTLDMVTEPDESANPVNKENLKNLVGMYPITKDLISVGYVLVVLRKEIVDNRIAT